MWWGGGSTSGGARGPFCVAAGGLATACGLSNSRMRTTASPISLLGGEFGVSANSNSLRTCSTGIPLATQDVERTGTE